jgi:putative ABC transport system ATP-binding protein
LRLDEAAVCAGVVKIYWTETSEVHALKGIDARFPSGRVTAVVGPSGSGKSSLLRILAGLDRPTAGSVAIGGRETAGMSQRDLHALRRHLIGYVFQRPSDNLIPYLSVREQLEHAVRLRGGVGASKLDEVVERLGLTHRLRHLPHQLSGGEQQRVAFAQAVVGDPVLVVADEPTAELDLASAHALLTTVEELARDGIGVVMSTHDPEVVKMADKTLMLRHGAVEAELQQERSLSVIDAAGRIQLPPEALRLFPTHRAVLEFDQDGVRITPP